MSKYTATLVALAIALSACGANPDPEPEDASVSQVGVSADPAFIGTWWRLQSLGGEPPAEGVRPVLIFTDTPAERDAYDRPYPARFADWRIVKGESGVGLLYAPYRRVGDSLRFAETYDYTRASTAEEEAQAKRLAEALTRVRTVVQDGEQLAFLSAAGDTLVTFTADPSRPPGPLDDIEWVLTSIGDAPLPDRTRATLTFSSRRLGPGPDDGFDAFGGYSSCNWYGAGYRLDVVEDNLYRLTTSGSATATARGCEASASEVEEAVLNAVSQATHVHVTGSGDPGNRLTLLDSTGTELLTFDRHVPFSVDLEVLRRGRWQFSSTTNTHASVAEGLEVAFADSTFEATAGCYRLRGTYSVEGDNFWTPSQESDASTCTDPERPPAYDIPITSGKLSVTNNRLVLYDENGRATVFTRRN